MCAAEKAERQEAHTIAAEQDSSIPEQQEAAVQRWASPQSSMTMLQVLQFAHHGAGGFLTRGGC